MNVMNDSTLKALVNESGLILDCASVLYESLLTPTLT